MNATYMAFSAANIVSGTKNTVSITTTKVNQGVFMQVNFNNVHQTYLMVASIFICYKCFWQGKVGVVSYCHLCT